MKKHFGDLPEGATFEYAGHIWVKDTTIIGYCQALGKGRRFGYWELVKVV